MQRYFLYIVIISFLCVASGCATTQNQTDFFEATGQDSDESNPVADFLAGKEHYLKGEYELATTYLISAIQTKQTIPDAYIYLGNIHFRDGHFLESAKYYQEAINIDQNNVSANYNLLITHLREASQQLEKLSLLDTQNRISEQRVLAFKQALTALLTPEKLSPENQHRDESFSKGDIRPNIDTEDAVDSNTE